MNWRWSWCVRLSAPPCAPLFGPRVSGVRRPFPPCFIYFLWRQERTTQESSLLPSPSNLSRYFPGDQVRDSACRPHPSVPHAPCTHRDCVCHCPLRACCVGQRRAMPAKSKRSKGQRDRRECEAKLPPDERAALLNDYSQTRGAVAARDRRPREGVREAERRKRRVQGLLTHRDDALDAGWHPEWRPLAGERRWRSLPADVLTVARCFCDSCSSPLALALLPSRLLASRHLTILLPCLAWCHLLTIGLRVSVQVWRVRHPRVELHVQATEQVHQRRGASRRDTAFHAACRVRPGQSVRRARGEPS